MSKIKPPALTEDEIEEELLNNDLMNSGAVENQTDLQQMDIVEKKNLLHGIKQSKENLRSETGTISRQLKNPITIDTSLAEFPALAAPAKGNKLKLPRKQPSTPKPDSDDSSDRCISLVDEDDDDDESLFTKPKKFCLPFCVSDNAPPLQMPDRPFRRDKCPYYQMKGEYAMDALRRMLAHHDSWKAKYNAETTKLESRALNENNEDFDSRESKNEENGDSENDPYTFKEVTKVYSGPGSKKRETIKSLDNSRTPQRRGSRDSDCEEIQPTLKPDEPKLSEWITTAKPRNKRNRKHISNQERTQSQADVEFDFDSNRTLWPAGRSGGGPQSPNPTLNRRSMPMPSLTEVQEEKVQCPICQKEFTLSTVENHAATCEGFSSSPMDVEEGT